MTLLTLVVQARKGMRSKPFVRAGMLGVLMSTGAGSVVTLRLLRGFALTVDDKRIPLTSSAQRVLGFLALKGRPLTRSGVAGALWPETPTLNANANLRSSLWRSQGPWGRLVDTSGQQLSLAGHVAVDVQTARVSASRLLDTSDQCEDLLTGETRASLSADLLPDWDDDWVLMEREQYHQLRLYALEAMCDRLICAGRYGEAVDAGLEAVRAEPLRESGHQALVKAHLAAGNRWEAVRQYDRCRRLLLDELGLEPSTALSRLLPIQAARQRTRADHRV